jgi:hypothetical protein
LRLMRQLLSEGFDQQVVVRNSAGAGGNLAVEAVLITIRREICEWCRPKRGHEELQIPKGDLLAHLHHLVWVPSRQHVIEH